MVSKYYSPAKMNKGEMADSNEGHRIYKVSLGHLVEKQVLEKKIMFSKKLY